MSLVITLLQITFFVSNLHTNFSSMLVNYKYTCSNCHHSPVSCYNFAITHAHMCHCRHIFSYKPPASVYISNMTFVTTNCSPVSLVLFLAISVSDLVQFAWGHGRVLEPPSRASLWRFSEFEYLQPPKNYDDNQLFCGNMTVSSHPIFLEINKFTKLIVLF